ncbi:MAG TPA: hypothetical protein IAD28_06310 [Candidatus Faeciplasma avium]|uniref:Twitching motility protein PilT n=1 Tax=Candidatus Faeciplasma avium TaxID=2840798 RepID=A0A9D1NQY9_9FIRM|nr:hypothetical protein [Candidatus Faeciplasma avium]
MIKIITGKRGSGKTKVLVDLIKEAAKNTTGNVVCIEKNMQLTYDIPYSVRLVDVDGYNVDSYDKFYGFIAGTVASNYDIKEVFVDGILKIGGRDYDKLADLFEKVDKITKDIIVVFTVSEDNENLPESVKKYLD